MDLKGIGNNGYRNNNIKANDSDIKRVKGYGLLEGIKNFFRNLHISRVFSKSILSRKAEVQNKSDEHTNTPLLKTTDDILKDNGTKSSIGKINSDIIKDPNALGKTTGISAKNPDFVTDTDQNPTTGIDENNVDNDSEKRAEDSLDTNKYSESCPTEMEIGGIQMSKIKTDNGIYVLPKAMYKGAGITLEEAAKKIFSGVKIYRDIFSTESDTPYGSTKKFLNKSDVANLMWFLEYKACCKNNKFMSMFASNMRIPDNDGKIYDAISNCVKFDVADTYGSVYDRSGKNQSSHFKQNDAKNIQKTQKGLDFKYGDLPFGAKTILFAHGNPNSASDVPKGTYIKLEKEGINSGFFSLLMHGMNFIKSLFRKVPKECDFREKIKICEKLSKYGETISEIFLNKNLETEIKDFVGGAGIDVENINVRLGRELILTEKDMKDNTGFSIGEH